MCLESNHFSPLLPSPSSSKTPSSLARAITISTNFLFSPSAYLPPPQVSSCTVAREILLKSKSDPVILHLKTLWWLHLMSNRSQSLCNGLTPYMICLLAHHLSDFLSYNSAPFTYYGLASLNFFKHFRQIPASRPLHWLFPRPGVLFPQYPHCLHAYFFYVFIRSHLLNKAYLIPVLVS